MSNLQTGASFALKLDRLQNAVGYSRVLSEEDREAIFRLRYDCYLAEGAIEPSSTRRYADRRDDDPNAFIFAIRFEGQLAGSIRLHVSSPRHPDGPGLAVFPHELGAMIDRGESFVDPTRFVVDRRLRSATALMPYATLRLAAMAADHFDTDQILATVRIEHAPFYRRIFGLEPLAPPRHYPSLTKPICLLAGHTDAIRDTVYRRYPIFSSDPEERVALFGPSRSTDFRSASAMPVNDNAGRLYRRSGTAELRAGTPDAAGSGEGLTPAV